ncbi:unnamed protein product [Trichobilharzia szidati]|nr:unnamed protein product [Trichobilharzia szidati]
MPFVTSSGNVVEQQPWGLRYFKQLLFNLFHIICLFIQTMLPLDYLTKEVHGMGDHLDHLDDDSEDLEAVEMHLVLPRWLVVDEVNSSLE